MDLGEIVSIEMVRAKGSQLLSGFFFPSLSSIQSLQCFPISIEIRGTLERILLEAMRREKMKRGKEIEVPTPPRGKIRQQTRDHVLQQEERRGKFHAEPEKEIQKSKEIALLGEGRHIN